MVKPVARVLMVVLLLATTACVHAIRVSVRGETNEDSLASDADVSTALHIVDRIARDFEFKRHPDELDYIEDSHRREWIEVYDIAVYSYAGSKWQGRITILLSLDKRDGHLVVAITRLDAYVPSTFVDSLEHAIVSALTDAFPARRVVVGRSRGISPLGP